ncbi:MAG: twin-arginine translocase TatA/TatE family subunit [Anaerolineales bacterium]
MDFHLMHLSAALIFDSPMDIGVVLLIVLILFGGKKIPEVMRGLGQGIREFKGGMRDDQPTTTTTAQAAPPAAVSTPQTTEKK